MDRRDYVLEAFRRAGVDDPTVDQLDTACARLDGLDGISGAAKKLSKKELEERADQAVSVCVKGGGA